MGFRRRCPEEARSSLSRTIEDTLPPEGPTPDQRRKNVRCEARPPKGRRWTVIVSSPYKPACSSYQNFNWCAKTTLGSVEPWKRSRLNICFEIVEGKDDLRQLYAAWEELYSARTFEASLSVSWTEALLKSHLESYPVTTIVLRDVTSVVGIMPLYIKTVSKARASLLTLCPVAEHFNTHSDILLRDYSVEAMAALLKGISSIKARWDVFRINRFVVGHPALQAMDCALRGTAKLPYRIDVNEPSFYIPLQGGFDTYLKERSGNTRSSIKRLGKKLYASGDVKIVRYHDNYDPKITFQTIRLIEDRSWKHKNGTGITSTETQRVFYQELCRQEFAEGRLRLWVLHLNERPIAYELGIVSEGRYYDVHGSYDHEFKNEGPGTILFALVIRELMEEGMHELDFFGEPFEAQRRWTQVARCHRALLIYNRTPNAYLFRAFNAVRDVMAAPSQRELAVRRARE